MRILRLFRWILVPLAIATLFLWSVLHTAEFCPSVEKGGVAILYANQCQDDMRAVFLNAIEEAEHSIHLIIYSFSDPKLLSAIQKRANKGITVTVIHDSSSSQRGFHKLKAPIIKKSINSSGLMHQKILVTDHEKVWIGSTNWTKQSLRTQKNLVAGVYSPELAETIETKGSHHHFTAGSQRLEFWTSPKESHLALTHLIELIDEAKESIRIGMFVWTHPSLTEAVIRAQARGVKSEVVLDPKMATYTSKKALLKMQDAGIDVRTYAGIGTFHHKFAWIDGTTLINGSLNWTNAAFKRNWDCFLILHELTEMQQDKMNDLWHIIRSTSRSATSHSTTSHSVTSHLADKQHLSILWKRPHFVVDESLEPISIAA